MSCPVVEVRELRKSYGSVVAVDGLSFDVDAATIFALVGPNGSGKTTTVECLEGLREPDGGTVRILGLDPARDRDKFYRRVGVQLQEVTYHRQIKLREALWLYRGFYDHPLDDEELMQAFGLESKRGAYFGNLSGGQQRRFLTVLALLGNPELAILDEPTTGLDPQARMNVWDVLRGFRERGTSIIVTTHYLQEAQQHCDVTAIIDHGRLLALDAPATLLASYGMETQIVLPSAAGFREESLRGEPGTSQVEMVNGSVHVFGEGQEFVGAITRMAASHGVGLQDLEVRRANLEDLFLLLTGREYRDE